MKASSRVVLAMPQSRMPSSCLRAVCVCVCVCARLAGSLEAIDEAQQPLPERSGTRFAALDRDQTRERERKTLGMRMPMRRTSHGLEDMRQRNMADGQLELERAS